jgi:hypothetical protein
LSACKGKNCQINTQGESTMKVQSILLIMWIVVMIFLLANWLNKPKKNSRD